ncbi:BamA/TamA family outer membrane protein [Polymorphobacter fuscus]|uniref:BamA/TamA family outer membrane protein n=1 Tax=Sandarakinorhabdus fusca TaxID=1439888 RepID=A0A7C9KJD7_9SPHN|nr:BamA/TamA family outer membrane protein [Polymorphobacter fuscus]KAB7648256.1 BamA/TamA family outer membrane protein [Polymorphobacter fuscus]MQT15763.1 BamA/TamA family outer membrane protein [Polymorphobacter fuscus]NJC07965.1 translocation and assembly module TamA [Polymorphobacter fuscus]
MPNDLKKPAPFAQARRTPKILALFGVATLTTAAAAQPVSTPPVPAPNDTMPAATPVLPPDLSAELPPLEPIVATPPEAAPAPLVPAAELAAPLAGLGSVTPPPAMPASSDPELPPIRYRLTIEGLDAVDLEDRFRDLSALLDGGRKAGNAAQVSARADADVQLAENLLRSEGYYDAAASAVVGPLPDADGQLLVAITATPGTRYSLGTVTLTSSTDTPLAAEPLAIAREALALSTGDPIVAAAIEVAEANVALRLPEQGYPFVVVGQRDILLDDVTFTGDYSLPLTAGRKARFGGFRLAGDPVFDAKHIGILPRFKAGEIYDSRRVDDLRQVLIATSLLSTVAVEPVGTGVIDADGVETVDLLVRQTRGPARNLAANAGYGTGEGVRVSASWTHRNLFPPEGALSAAVVAGTNEQSLRGQFIRSNAGQRDRAFQAGASVARQRFDAFNAETINLNASLARVSTPIWQKRWTWSLGGELIASRETAFDPALAAEDRGTYLIAALPTQLGYDRSDSLLDPTRGFRLVARASPEAQKRTGGSFDAYGRFLFEASAYYPVMSSLVIAGRARLGSIVGAPRDEIAPSRRLYAGGGGSVRGFGFQQLGPRGADNQPLGGRSLTEFAIEARYRFGDFGVVPFIDAGRLGDASTPSLSGMRYGVGIGGRYYTNFGPMRVDIATPINRRPGESRVALYISIGQAF